MADDEVEVVATVECTSLILAPPQIPLRELTALCTDPLAVFKGPMPTFKGREHRRTRRGAGGTCPPPKKNNENTTKNENSSKLPFAEEFSEMGWGQSVISSAVVGQDCSCRERKSILSEQKTARPVIWIWDGLGVSSRR